jgi:Fic family protein
VIIILRNETIEEMNSEGVKDFFECVKVENERVKNEIMQIYFFIEQNPLVKIEAIEKFNKKSNTTNKRYLKTLKNNGLIEHIGPDKTGGYRVVTKNG